MSSGEKDLAVNDIVLTREGIFVLFSLMYM